MDSEIVLQSMKANPASSTQRVSGEFDMSKSSVVLHLHDLSQSILSCQIMPHITKILKLFTFHNTFLLLLHDMQLNQPIKSCFFMTVSKHQVDSIQLDKIYTSIYIYI